MSQEISVSHCLSSLGCGCCGFLFDCLNVFTLCIKILFSATVEIEFPAIIVISGLKSCVVPIFGCTPEPGCGTMICKGPQHIRIHWRLEFSVEDWSGIGSFEKTHVVVCSFPHRIWWPAHVETICSAHVVQFVKVFSLFLGAVVRHAHEKIDATTENTRSSYNASEPT